MIYGLTVVTNKRAVCTSGLVTLSLFKNKQKSCMKSALHWLHMYSCTHCQDLLSLNYVEFIDLNSSQELKTSKCKWFHKNKLSYQLVNIKYLAGNIFPLFSA